ncbi:hypothetical protein JBL43_08065 [Aureibaculum sp. A20]|uniref:Uncharacterized protein n=1 Tax=Aureibaculum flavum TaxID=2795986 RepID=A0ABS0WQE6_9FLAO|nr:hypothetical protein [Aureibaculum flavum]MBJ2174189.1 hypothetical protein [Aureibaculum flavum]
MKGTPAPKGSCKEPRNTNSFDDFGKYTLIYGLIFAVIGLILKYFNII